jgi:nuclear GTP-binding protein
MAKSQSKRMTLRQKYKIKRKVSEHIRQQKKAAKKAKAQGIKKKKPKIVNGIPNNYPFKDNVLQNLALRKEEKEMEMKKAKLERRETKKRLRSIEEVAMDAQSKNVEYSSRLTLSDAPEAGFSATDSSRKAYFREFRRVVDESDVILEVLDARDPLGCRCVDIEKFIMQRDPQKRIVLVLNKIDMIPRENAQQWLTYLRKQLPTVAFKASTQQQQRIGHMKVDLSKVSESQMKSKECLGADVLLKLLKNYARNRDIKTAISVGVIGYPNVGKSSLINSLKREKVVVVGATPGVTKVKQEIHLDKHIRLLDCPGIVFAAKDTTDTGILLRSNAIKVNQIDDSAAAVDLIVKQCSKEKLMALYAIADFKDSREFLGQLAQKRGKMKKRGVPNYEEVARVVLQDWNSGKVPFFTVPPLPSSSSSSSLLVDESTSSSLVTQWAKEFDIDALLSDEKEVLDSANVHLDGEQLVGGGTSIDGEMLETHMEESVQISIAPIKKRKKMDNDKGKDEELPESINKLWKKEQKKLKKSRAASSDAMEESADMNGDYSFSSDFVPASFANGNEEEDDDDDDIGEEEEGEEEDDDDDGEDLDIQ